MTTFTFRDGMILARLCCARQKVVMRCNMSLDIEVLPALQKLTILASDALSIHVRQPPLVGSRLQDLQLLGDPMWRDWKT